MSCAAGIILLYGTLGSGDSRTRTSAEIRLEHSYNSLHRRRYDVRHESQPNKLVCVLTNEEVLKLSSSRSGSPARTPPPFGGSPPAGLRCGSPTLHTDKFKIGVPHLMTPCPTPNRGRFQCGSTRLPHDSHTRTCPDKPNEQVLAQGFRAWNRRESDANR